MKFSLYIAFSLLLGPILSLHAGVLSVKNDTCQPAYSDIYNYEVGDVFQYREISTSSAGGLNPTQEIITQFTILSKEVDSNIVSYYVNGWKESRYYHNPSNEEPSDSDTTKDFEYIDEYYVYIDSGLNFLNMCSKEVILLQNECFIEMNLQNLYSRVQTSYADTNLVKSIGGQGNVFKYNENDSLVAISDVYFEAIYKEGLGLISQEFTFFEIRETIELEAYVKGQDTVGVLLEGDYPDYLASDINNTAFNESFRIYPNPAQGIINIESYNIKLASAEIYNINGQMIFEELMPSEQIDLRFLESGIYFIRLRTEKNQFQTMKLFIK